MRRKELRVIAGIIALIMLALVIWHDWHSLKGFAWFNRAEFITVFRGAGLWSVIPLALVLMAVSMIPGAPNSVIAVLNGVCLGAPLGFVVNVIGLSLGNCLGSLLIDRIELHHQSPKRSRLLDDLMKASHPKLGVLLGYSVPFVPNTLVHLAAGQLQLPRKIWNSLIVLGSLPTAFFYAFGGDAALRLRPGRLVIAIGLIAASALVIQVIRRDRKRELK